MVMMVECKDHNKLQQSERYYHDQFKTSSVNHKMKKKYHTKYGKQIDGFK